MKKFLLIALFGILAMSCATDRTVYGFSIEYEIDGVRYTDTGTIECFEGCVPVYIQGKGSIVVNQATQYGRAEVFRYISVYNGLKDCKVTNFEYWPVRTYKLGKISGREIKKQ